MMHHETRYLPAAGRDLFLPLYDPIVRLLMRERTLRQKFLEQADIGRNHHVLDLGCGTGTMAILIRQRRPESTVVGVDGDPKVLDIARRKAATSSLSIQFDESLADRLPYSDGSFDRVLCSFVLHHLTYEGKIGALREAHRVLKPDGSFYLADFGPLSAGMPLSSLGSSPVESGSVRTSKVAFPNSWPRRDSRRSGSGAT